MPGRYLVHHYWSIAHGCRVSKVLLTDAHGRAHYAIVPRRELLGAEYRAKLDALLDRIQGAIDAGHAPGEVTSE